MSIFYYLLFFIPVEQDCTTHTPGRAAINFDKYLNYIWHTSVCPSLCLSVTHGYRIWQNPLKICPCSHNNGPEERLPPRRNFWVGEDYGGFGPRLSGASGRPCSIFLNICPSKCLFLRRKFFSDAIVSPSTTLEYFGPPGTDFSELCYIAYLDLEILILNVKKIWPLETVVYRLPQALGLWRSIF